MSSSTLCPDFVVVPPHVARNPVARAIARQRITSAMLDFRLRLYQIDDGEHVPADGLTAARVLAVAIRVAELRGQSDGADCRVMRGGLEAMVALSARRWRWRCADAPALDSALTRALQVYRGASAVEQQRAYAFVMELERTLGHAPAHTGATA